MASAMATGIPINSNPKRVSPMKTGKIISPSPTRSPTARIKPPMISCTAAVLRQPACRGWRKPSMALSISASACMARMAKPMGMNERKSQRCGSPPGSGEPSSMR